MAVRAQQGQTPGGGQSTVVRLIGQHADPIVTLNAVGGLEQVQIGGGVMEFGDRLPPRISQHASGGLGP